jgi:polysaccharide export outer membrane protein
MNIEKVTGKNHLRLGLIALVVMVISTSCGTTRPYTYMQGGFDTTAYSKIPNFDPKIKGGDLLSIMVFSDNPDASAIYNQGGSAALQLPTTPGNAGASSGGSGGASRGGSNPTPQGYLVDERGNIAFRDIGVLHVEGLTRGQLTDTLNARLERGELLTHPYCNVRVLNYKFRMLGELSKPGEFSIPDEKINILEAIAMAGDLTVYGRRDNVLIIREDSGKREFGRIDLTNPNIMTSPYFYLQQNDLVIVEQTRKKSVANDVVTLRNVSIVTSVVTVAAILYSIFKK